MTIWSFGLLEGNVAHEDGPQSKIRVSCLKRVAMVRKPVNIK